MREHPHRVCKMDKSSRRSYIALNVVPAPTGKFANKDACCLSKPAYGRTKIIIYPPSID
jgi:hypothetical protein